MVLLHQSNADITAPCLDGGDTGGAGTGKRIENNGVRACEALDQRLQAGNRLFGRVVAVAGIFSRNHVIQRVLRQGRTAFCQDVGTFVAVAHIGGLRCVGFGENQMTNNTEPGTFPSGHKTIDAVPAVETDHQCVFFEDAVHLIAGGLQPFVGFATGNTASVPCCPEPVRRDR